MLDSVASQVEIYLRVSPSTEHRGPATRHLIRSTPEFVEG